MVFSIPSQGIKYIFPRAQTNEDIPPVHLAYVEWFTRLRQQPEPHHGLYKLSRSMQGGQQMASVIPVANITRSAHLYPRFGANVPEEWTYWNVLDLCPSFFLNSCSDRHAFVTMC